MTWEIWRLRDDKIIGIEPFGDDGDAARARFNEIEAARQSGVWELRKGGVYVSLFSLTPGSEEKP